MIWKQITFRPLGSTAAVRVEVCMDDEYTEAVVLRKTGDHWVPIPCNQGNITDEERTLY